MQEYEIVAESHEGVVDCPEDILGSVLANSETEAIYRFIESGERIPWCKEGIHWCENWNCFLLGGARKVFARKIQ